MKVAYLFVEKYPNYDLLGRLFSALNFEDFKDLDTNIRAGLWGFEGVGNSLDINIRTQQILNCIISAEGNIFSFNSQNSSEKLFSKPIYVVQLDSIKKELASKIHNKLKDCNEYMGFSEVILSNPVHYKTFTGYPPLVNICNSKINFLKIGAEDDSLNEMLNWFELNNHCYSSFMNIAENSFRYSILDKYGDDSFDRTVDSLLNDLKYEWEYLDQKTIYKLMNIDPKIVEELVSAIKVLTEGIDNAAEVSKFTLNIRRALEKLIDKLVPPNSNTQKQKPKDRYKKYIEDNLVENSFYKEYIEVELLEIYTRLEKIYNLSNKGIHEDYSRSIIVNLIMRTILFMNDILEPKKVKKPSIYYEEVLFE